MKVTIDENYRPRVKFHTIADGECFLIAGESEDEVVYYMKTSGKFEVQTNAVNLKTGCNVCFGTDALVTPVEAEVRVGW